MSQSSSSSSAESFPARPSGTRPQSASLIESLREPSRGANSPISTESSASSAIDLIRKDLEKLKIAPDAQPHTFGIELEMFISHLSEAHPHPPDGTWEDDDLSSKRCTWDALQNHLAVAGIESIVCVNETKAENDTTKWVITDDCSIAYTTDEVVQPFVAQFGDNVEWEPDNGVESMLKCDSVPGLVLEHADLELNSPIFDLGDIESAISQVDAVLQEINNGPFYVNLNRTCGMHVHIGAGVGLGFPLEFLKRVAMVTTICEYAMDQLFTPDRSDDSAYNHGCWENLIFYDHKTPSSTVAEVCNYIQIRDTAYDLLHNMPGNKVSIMKYARKGTIEFRQHEATLNIEDIRMWVRLLAALMNGLSKETLSSVEQKLKDPFGDGSEYQWPPKRNTDFDMEYKLMEHNSAYQFLKKFIDDAEVVDYYMRKIEYLHKSSLRRPHPSSDTDSLGTDYEDVTEQAAELEQSITNHSSFDDLPQTSSSESEVDTENHSSPIADSGSSALADRDSDPFISSGDSSSPEKPGNSPVQIPINPLLPKSDCPTPPTDLGILPLKLSTSLVSSVKPLTRTLESQTIDVYPRHWSSLPASQPHPTGIKRQRDPVLDVYPRKWISVEKRPDYVLPFVQFQTTTPPPMPVNINDEQPLVEFRPPFLAPE